MWTFRGCNAAAKCYSLPVILPCMSENAALFGLRGSRDMQMQCAMRQRCGESERRKRAVDQISFGGVQLFNKVVLAVHGRIATPR